MVTSFAQLDLNGTYTYADYLLWAFDRRVELIKGKIFDMSPAPLRAHQQVASNLHTIIGSFLRGRSCKVYSAPFDVRLPLKGQSEASETYTVVQPDLCVICDMAKLDRRGCTGAPDLVIEILSPGNSKTEMKQKYEVYEESGVKEYWLVIPEQKAVLVFLLDEEKGKFYGIQPSVEGDLMLSRTLPGLEVDLTEVFAD